MHSEFKKRSRNCKYSQIAIVLLAGMYSLLAVACENETRIARLDSFHADVTLDDQAVVVGMPICSGMVLKTGKASRAAVQLLEGETLLRLNENSVLRFRPKVQKRWYLELKQGFIYLFSRVPETLEVDTPFVNGGIEGTEFFVKVGHDHTDISVFEGIVAATNAQGEVKIKKGQSIRAYANLPPQNYVIARPRDAVQWAIYFPLVLDVALDEKLQQAYRLLRAGRWDQASRTLKQRLKDADAVGLRAVVAVLQNHKQKALNLGEKALQINPNSLTARLGYSYALQANFRLEEAVNQVKSALKIHPDSGFAHARHAELLLALGQIDAALTATDRAIELLPNNALALSVRGFALLAAKKIANAYQAFDQALALQAEDPLPRLGRGLALIRQGKLLQGRKDIEIAVIHDPNNAMLRSYMGKAYQTEKRFEVADLQYGIAKKIDPLDPTPWYYSAFLRQAMNQPGLALQEIEQSIALNDNRAVFRSRLLLDEDLAARNASSSAIYRSLGFDRLALVEAWNALATSPTDYSAHRLLSESYAVTDQHEFARDSELLKTQLLQPVNQVPVDPKLSTDGLGLLEDLGALGLGLNEYGQLYSADGLNLKTAAIGGSQSTFALSNIVYGSFDDLSFSAGLLQYESDGFKPNTDEKSTLGNAFFQYSPTSNLSLLLDYRHSAQAFGSQNRFTLNELLPGIRESVDIDSVRIGGRYRLGAENLLLATAVHQTSNERTRLPGVFSLTTDQTLKVFEVQHLKRVLPKWYLTYGFSYVDVESTVSNAIPNIGTFSTRLEEINRDLYLYSDFQVSSKLDLTIGLSAGEVDNDPASQSLLNPKFGLVWHPTDRTTIRAAAFRTLYRNLASGQTLEPTNVAGFSQFIDGESAESAWLYGIGLDQKITQKWYAGFQISERQRQRPLILLNTNTVDFRDSLEQEISAYSYHLIGQNLAVSLGYSYEYFENEAASGFPFLDFTTHRVPLEVRYFLPNGWSFRLKETYFNQSSRREVFDFIQGLTIQREDDDFLTLDASVEYKFPKNLGSFAFEIRNLFDQTNNYRTIDRFNSTVAEERQILATFKLNF